MHRRAKSPFLRVKEIYGYELEQHQTTQLGEKQPPQPLSERQRLEIRKRVIAEVARERRQNFLIASFIIVLLILAIYLIKNLRFSLFDDL